MPQWLKTMLLAVGLLILAAFLAEPVLVVRRRRQQATDQHSSAKQATAKQATAKQAAVQEDDTVPLAAVQTLPLGKGIPGPRPGCWRPGEGRAHIVLADHDRLVVTHNMRDGTVYVLRPPGEDPEAILRVARLVLPEDLYRELAGQLGMPAS